MNNNVKLYIKEKGFVELAEEFPISLNFSVADIADITKRSGSFSKTISVPSTPANDLLFGQLYNICTSDNEFDLNKKYECILFQNEVPVFEGYIILQNIVKNPNSNFFNENYDAVYNITLYSKTVDFFTIIDGKYLDEIDFHINTHQITDTDILATSAHTYLDVYKYFNFFNGGATYEPADFWHAIYAKQYADRIISDAGYNYNPAESTFLNEEPFTKLVIPYSGTLNVKDKTLWENEKFYGQQTATTAHNFTWLNQIKSGAFQFDNYYTPYFKNSYSEPVGVVYTASMGGVQNIVFEASGQINYSANTDCWYGDYFGHTPSNITGHTRVRQIPIKILVKKNGAVVAQKNVYSNTLLLPVKDSPDLTTPDMTAGTQYTASWTVSGTLDNLNLYNGDTLQLEYIFDAFGNWSNFGFYSNSGQTGYQNVISFNITDSIYPAGTFTINNASWYNNPIGTTTRQNYDVVDINNYIPKNVKQKDFLATILKTFNLYIDVDNTDYNRLLIKHRDEFYNTQIYKDWSNKIDRSKEITVKYLPDLQKKEVTLTYKDGGSDWDKAYKDFYNETYGQQKIVYETETVIGEEKKENSLFYSAPLVYNGNLVVSGIQSKEPKNLYLLYDGGQQQGSWSFKFGNTTHNLTGYSYCGHWDNPTQPAFDLNYGENKAYFIDLNYYTENNLYNLYFANTFRQIAEQKMITAYFVLNENDIATLKFSDKIIIDNNSYVLNSISDYNPFSKAPVKVELVQFDDIYTKPKGRKKPIKISGHTFQNISSLVKPQIQANLLNNTISAGASIIDVKGNANRIDASENVYVIGNKNTIEGGTKDVYLFNTSNQTITSDLQNVMLFGVSDESYSATSNSFVVNAETIALSGNVTINNSTIAEIISSATTSTSLQNGLNTFTGGTSTAPSINISAATLNSLNVSGSSALGAVSATSIFSGATNLNLIFASTTHTHTLANITATAHTHSISEIAAAGNSTNVQYNNGGNFAGSDNFIFEETPILTNVSLSVKTDGDSKAALTYLLDNTTPVTQLRATGNADFELGFGSSLDTLIHCNNSTNLIGIKTSTPTHLLTVNGSLSAVTAYATNIYSGASNLNTVFSSTGHSHSLNQITATGHTHNSYITLPVVASIATTFTPSDLAVYYIGGGGMPSTTARSRRIYIFNAGIIKAATVWGYCPATAGSGENISMYIRLNNSSDTLIQTEGVAANARNWENTGLSIAVASGDYIEIKMICSSFATNPIFDTLNGYVLLEINQ